MLLPHNNPLPKPEILQTPVFEEFLSTVKTFAVDYVKSQSEEQGALLEETLNNSAEILTKLTEAFTVYLQNHTRQWNDKALQMFGMYARDDDIVDVIVSSLNVTRQVIKEGDPNAFPPVAPVLEDNNTLLTRYYLAAFALASTGTRLGYRYHLMTLGSRPETRIESPESSKVVVTYDFPSTDFGGQVRDAQARQTAPATVQCFILSHGESGIPGEDLLSFANEYINRDDIAQETDLVSVHAPNIITWDLEAVLTVGRGSDSSLRKAAAIDAANEYALSQFVLAGRIEPSVITSILLMESGANSVEVISPSQPLRLAHNEAPKIGNINITINTE